MKILHFITSLRTGGAERLVLDLLKRMKAEGHEVELLLMDGTRTPLFEEAEASGIRTSSLSEGWKSMRNPLLLPSLMRFMRAGRFDVVHTHNTACQLLAAAASFFVKTRLVTTEHNSTNRRRRWTLYRPVDSLMYSKYKAIVCVGEDVRRSLLAAFPRLERKVCVVSNGIDTDRFRQAAPDAEISSLPGRKVLMVAAFRPQKDQKTLIRAARLLPQGFNVLFAGGSETEEDRRYLQECMTLAEGSDRGARVRFLGVRSDVPALMAACDILVLSSHYEGAPIAALEAMASGKPFIASDVEGLHSMVSRAGELFPEGNAKSLADRIIELATDPLKSAKVAQRCMKRASGFDILGTAESYINIYKLI